jgi:uncharacterized protein
MPEVSISNLDLSENYLKILREILKKYVPDAEVWAYGSRVNGDGHECSDLDLVLRHSKDLCLDVESWLDLKEALQNEYRLPMLIDIHLWSRLPAAFHDEIKRRYVLI